ncbi:MAG TPA: aspartate kinase [Chitinophagaceae bacterium]|nr:aspartate kinase [Chitinophagaceae bacterium]
MKVFKFGGASVNSVERIKNLAVLMQQFTNEKLIIIISAMGKTTNALEKVAEAFYNENKEETLQLFNAVKEQHNQIAEELLGTKKDKCISQLSDFFTEVEWLLHDKPVREFDYYYDQIVCCGELLSTCIISYYLNESEIKNKWIDVRDVIRTDNNFRDAGIDWERTKSAIDQLQSSSQNNITITQGFIGATDENESTTLGREGSDYTAAVFANILNAQSVTIWKDVEGVMNADPKIFPDAKVIKELSFDEVIEMAFYGAQVIHPKTIKPLQNKGIPLLVKCFLNPAAEGTIIHKNHIKNLPPIIVIKQKQALLHLESKDYSFVGEKLMAELYKTFSLLKIKPNIIQTGAINVQLCLDDQKEKTEKFAGAVSETFDVQVEKDLSLLTIRHYNEKIMNEMLVAKDVVLLQKTKETMQAVYR